jgi:hypothetical protein
MEVGVSKAAGWTLVGEYLQGLSGLPVWAGVVQVASTVFVVVPKTLVMETLVLADMC